MIALDCTDSGIEKSPTAAFIAGYNRSIIHRSGPEGGGNIGLLPGYQWASSVMSANKSMVQQSSSLRQAGFRTRVSFP